MKPGVAYSAGVAQCAKLRRMRKKHLHLKAETLRTLTGIGLGAVHGGMPAITDGNNGCHSEATGCPTISPGWSCVWGSCPAVKI